MADPNSPQTVMSQSNTNTSSLSYPADIKSAAFFSTLTFKKYNRQKPSSQNKETITGTIVLPIPLDFGDKQEAIWNSVQMGVVGSEIADFTQAQRDATRKGASVIAELAKGNFANSGALRAAAVAAITVAPQSMQDGNPIFNRISQEIGLIKNPHLVSQFEGVPLRTHTLSWRFAPRTQQEATSLGNIIKQIRTFSLPSYQTTTSKFCLDYPDTLEVTFTNVDANYKTKIFKSGITSFSTNLGPSGLAFYAGGRPVEVEMSLGLVELTINTREDFQDSTASTGS